MERWRKLWKKWDCMSGSVPLSPDNQLQSPQVGVEINTSVVQQDNLSKERIFGYIIAMTSLEQSRHILSLRFLLQKW